MKKLLTLVLISIFSIAFSQEKNLIDEERVISADSVYTKTDVPAEFPGGVVKFRQLFEQGFDPSAIEGTGDFKSVITFVILEDGRVDDVKVLGENKYYNMEVMSAFNRLKNKKWTPGKVNGKPVKSVFKMPLNMTFE